jgi:anti-sigma factor RsiW
MMKCRELAAFLMDYVSRELPEDTREVFEAHLSRCPNCREYLRQYEATIRAGQVACADEQSVAEAPEELIAAILAARKS